MMSIFEFERANIVRQKANPKHLLLLFFYPSRENKVWRDYVSFTSVKIFFYQPIAFTLSIFVIMSNSLNLFCVTRDFKNHYLWVEEMALLPHNYISESFHMKNGLFL